MDRDAYMSCFRFHIGL